MYHNLSYRIYRSRTYPCNAAEPGACLVECSPMCTQTFLFLEFILKDDSKIVINSMIHLGILPKSFLFEIDRASAKIIPFNL